MLPPAAREPTRTRRAEGGGRRGSAHYAGGVDGRILTVPNLVSFVRLLAIPYFWWVLLGERRVGLAAGAIFVVGVGAGVDGYRARRAGQVSRPGKILAAVAGRRMIASAVIGGLIAAVVP